MSKILYYYFFEIWISGEIFFEGMQLPVTIFSVFLYIECWEYCFHSCSVTIYVVLKNIAPNCPIFFNTFFLSVRKYVIPKTFFHLQNSFWWKKKFCQEKLFAEFSSYFLLNFFFFFSYAIFYSTKICYWPKKNLPETFSRHKKNVC